MKDSRIFSLEEPEFIGKMPVKQDLTVLSADDTKSEKLGWTVNIYNGSEVYKDLEAKIPLKKKSDIKVDDTVFVKFLDGNYREAKVNKNKQFGIFAETEYNAYLLEFKKDDRKCWISNTIINKKTAWWTGK